jgi:hypothetical protein
LASKTNFTQVNSFTPTIGLKMKKIGPTWLQERYKIEGYQLTHESYIGTIDKIELSSRNSIIQTFKPKYDVSTDNPLLHLEFRKDGGSL